MSQAPHVDRWLHRGRRALPVLVLAGLAAWPCIEAQDAMGVLHPDEVFQFLEPAYRLIHGHGVQAWEWQRGLRSWATPGLLAIVIQLTGLVGIGDPRAVRGAIAVLLFALHLAMLLAIARMAGRRVGRLLGFAVATAIAVDVPVIDFAGRTLSETFSTVFLVLGLERLDPIAPSRAARRVPRAALGGLLLALAFAARFGAAGALVGAGLAVLAGRDRRVIGGGMLGGAFGLFAVGLLDRLSWGGWFHSFVEYTEYNVLSGDAETRFGASSWQIYVPWLLGWIGPTALAGIFVVARKGRTAFPQPLFLAALTYLAITIWAAHKEPRFVYGPALLLAIAGTLVVVQAARTRSRSWGALTGVAVIAIALLHASSHYVPRLRPMWTGEFHLHADAGRVCPDLVAVGGDIWVTGGHFFLGEPQRPLRAEPSIHSLRPGDHCALVYAGGIPRSISIGGPGPLRDFRAIGRDRGAVLLMREGTTPLAR